MKLLDLRDIQKKKDYIYFDNFLDGAGDWVPTCDDSNEYDIVVELPLNDIEHTYYLCQEKSDSEQYLYRVINDE